MTLEHLASQFTSVRFSSFTLPFQDGKPDGNPPKVVPQHFYPYNYVPNFSYNVDAGAPPPLDDKKDGDRNKTTPSPLDKGKQRPPDGKENPSRPNENHQILKESIEMKAQMGPYAFQRPPHVREEELRRYVDCFCSCLASCLTTARSMLSPPIVRSRSREDFVQ